MPPIAQNPLILTEVRTVCHLAVRFDLVPWRSDKRAEYWNDCRPNILCSARNSMLRKKENRQATKHGPALISRFPTQP